MPNVSRQIAFKEITLRKYEKPDFLTPRELLKRFCLSIGLLQEGDSRDVIVDILAVFLLEKRPMSSKEIIDQAKSIREKNGLTNNGMTDPNVRRHLRRLREYNIIEKIANEYAIYEDLTLNEIFNNIKEFVVNPIMERVNEYSLKLDEKFKLNEK
ncbi:MAG: hypothetical protein PHT94_03170 [Candidatus Nanoarchaeia archaeon]|nr:hypothetical protein [Candidatus Nanoarchaeia archaeon]